MHEAKLSSLLIVDDSDLDREVVGLACASLGCPIDSITNPEEALDLYREKRHSLVLVDYVMEPINGIDLVKEILKFDPDATCVMMTGSPDARVLDFLYDEDLPDLVTKPIKPTHLKEQIRIALGRRLGGTASKSSVSLSLKMDHCLPLQGESLEIVRVRKQIADFLKSEFRSIIIQGPDGIGKPEVARFIHDNGNYANSAYNFLGLNNLSEEDLESKFISSSGELGEVFRNAAECTLVLAHLEALPLKLQDELAKVLPELSEKFRLIILTEESVDLLLAKGKLSDDLYFVLSYDVIEIPDLSERPMDVEAIIRFIFANKEAFRFEPSPEDNLDLLVITMRRTQLDRNIDEIFERIVGRSCRRVREMLQMQAQD